MNMPMAAITYFQQGFPDACRSSANSPVRGSAVAAVATSPLNRITEGLLANRHVCMYVYLRLGRHRNRFSSKDLDRTRTHVGHFLHYL